MKRCTQCGQLKDESEFWLKRDRGKLTRRATCKECYRNRPRIYAEAAQVSGKVCSVCGKWKPASEYYRHRICRDGIETYCKQCKADKRRIRDAKYPERVRSVDLKAKYGITIEQYHEMRERQEGHCAICGVEAGEKLVVDHNHQTGQVRGLLCHLCNAMIGCARESLDILAAAAAYLYAEQHPEAGAVRAEVRYLPATALLAVVPAGG